MRVLKMPITAEMMAAAISREGQTPTYDDLTIMESEVVSNYRVVGFLGEAAVGLAYPGLRPTDNRAHYDFLSPSGRPIELKTRNLKVAPGDDLYVWVNQRQLDNRRGEIYLFCGYYDQAVIVWGSKTKKEFIDESHLIREGEMMPPLRGRPVKQATRQDMRIIPVTWLDPVKDNSSQGEFYNV